MGAPIRRKAPEKIFLVVPLHFLALKAQLFVLVSVLVMVSTVWSVSSTFLSAVRLLTVPHAQPLVKVGACAPVPHGGGATVVLQLAVIKKL